MPIQPSGPSQGNYIKVTSPGVQNLAALNVTPGVMYQVTFSVFIDGTTAAIDEDNILLGASNGVSVSFNIHMLAPVGGIISQCTFFTRTDTSYIYCQTNVAGTTGSVYHVQLVATPYQEG